MNYSALHPQTDSADCYFAGDYGLDSPTFASSPSTPYYGWQAPSQPPSFPDPTATSTLAPFDYMGRPPADRRVTVPPSSSSRKTRATRPEPSRSVTSPTFPSHAMTAAPHTYPASHRPSHSPTLSHLDADGEDDHETTGTHCEQPAFIKQQCNTPLPSPPLPTARQQARRSSSSSPTAIKKEPKDARSGSGSGLGPPGSASSVRRERLLHQKVERKYREKLNGQIDAVWSVLSTVQPFMSSTAYGGAAARPSKGAVLALAVKYIEWNERERSGLAKENALLRNRIGVVQNVFHCDAGPAAHSSASMFAAAHMFDDVSCACNNCALSSFVETQLDISNVEMPDEAMGK